MNDLATRRNVTTRLEDAELVAERCLARCDELLAAGKALTGRVAQLEDRCQALSQMDDYNYRLMLMRLDAFKGAVDGFVGMTFLQRLRWLLYGG